jgi:hypothetical protein
VTVLRGDPDAVAAVADAHYIQQGVELGKVQDRAGVVAALRRQVIIYC